MGVSVGVLDHFNIRTRNLADTVRFYEDVLGLEKGARPNFAFPGAWMYSEGKAVVHLVDISKTDEAQKPDSGVVHHVAFASTGFDGMKQRLQSKGMTFDSRQVPGGSRTSCLSDRKSTRLNSSHQIISYAVFCLKKKNGNYNTYKSAITYIV